MKLIEFKAWLDGFNAAINGVPTKEQWELIKSKFDSLEPETVKITEVIKVPEVIRESYPVPYPAYPINPKPWWETQPLITFGTPILTTTVINTDSTIKF
jgi:hypothetical protein